MTIYDLDWKPARIGSGFFAEHHFGNGKTAYVRLEGLTSEGDESYRLTITTGGRITYCKDGLDRVALTSRLNYHA